MHIHVSEQGNRQVHMDEPGLLLLVNYRQNDLSLFDTIFWEISFLHNIPLKNDDVY